jgi:hypothetical protein
MRFLGLLTTFFFGSFLPGSAESEDFVPVAPVVVKEPPKSQWDDEDAEEEEVKQSWEEEDKPKPVSSCKCPKRSIGVVAV